MQLVRHARAVVAAVGAAALLLAALSLGMTQPAESSTAVRKASKAVIKDTAGNRIGAARFTPVDGRTKMVVRVRVAGVTPGFHGFHVHAVGACDPNSVDGSGNPVPFLSAGGHFNPGGGTHGAHAGDLPPILVTEDGVGFLKFRTDRFKMKELLDEDGSAVILHAGPDNLAHIPAAAGEAERYHSHVDDVFGPDAATRATGDAGARAGCGVIRKL